MRQCHSGRLVPTPQLVSKHTSQQQPHTVNQSGWTAGTNLQTYHHPNHINYTQLKHEASTWKLLCSLKGWRSLVCKPKLVSNTLYISSLFCRETVISMIRYLMRTQRALATWNIQLKYPSNFCSTSPPHTPSHQHWQVFFTTSLHLWLIQMQHACKTHIYPFGKRSQILLQIHKANGATGLISLVCITGISICSVVPTQHGFAESDQSFKQRMNKSGWEPIMVYVCWRRTKRNRLDLLTITICLVWNI